MKPLKIPTRRNRLEQIFDLMQAIKSYPKRAFSRQIAIAGIQYTPARELRDFLVGKGLLIINGKTVTATAKGSAWLRNVLELLAEVRESEV